MSRYTLRDVLTESKKNPRLNWRRSSGEGVWSGWWGDLPMRHRAWWQMALFAPGEGWLRWKHDYRERIDYVAPDYESWAVYPPLRRLWFQVRGLLQAPFLMRNEKLSWEEVKPDWSCLRADPERRRDLRG